MRKCGNCKNRCFESWSGIDNCFWYDRAATEQEEIEYASNCKQYEEGKPSCFDEENRYTSATHGDYSPSSPWNAPGMSIHDFI